MYRREDRLDQYALWRAFKEQAEALRKQIGDGGGEDGQGELGGVAGALQSCGCDNSGGARSQSSSSGMGGLMRPDALENASTLVAGGMLPVLPISKMRVVNTAAFELV